MRNYSGECEKLEEKTLVGLVDIWWRQLEWKVVGCWVASISRFGDREVQNGGNSVRR